METYEASFDVDSDSDSYAVRRILEQVYDAVREESRTVRDGSADASDLLGEFERLRDAAGDPGCGRLTITYERREE